MQIFIPSYNRPWTTTTPALLDSCGVRYILLLRNSAQADLYLKNPAFRAIKKRIAVLDKDLSVNYAREVARDELNYGDWCLQMDDNIKKFTVVEESFYRAAPELKEKPTRTEFGHIFNIPATFQMFYTQVLTDSIQEAEKRGANIVGFSSWENPYMRRRKFRDVGYTTNKCVLLRKTKLHWDQSEGHPAMEEYALCAAQHLEYGRVLINNWGYPQGGHYEPGGLGTYEERLPQKIAACQNIMARWPGFAKLSWKKQTDREGELWIPMRTLEQCERWRQEMKASGSDPNQRDEPSRT